MTDGELVGVPVPTTLGRGSPLISVSGDCLRDPRCFPFDRLLVEINAAKRRESEDDARLGAEVVLEGIARMAKRLSRGVKPVETTLFATQKMNCDESAICFLYPYSILKPQLSFSPSSYANACSFEKGLEVNFTYPQLVPTYPPA